MGLEDLSSSDGSTQNSSRNTGDSDSSDEFPGFGSSSSSSRGGHTGTSNRWVTKINFSGPYVVVARDRQGNIYKSKESLTMLKDSDDWKRLEEHPTKEYESLFEKETKAGWFRFCNLVQDQLGEDPNEVLEEEPTRLVELEDKVYYPPGRKPDKSRTCQVCGSTTDEEGVDMLEVDLQKHRRTPVCSSHTVAELAEEGYLQ